MILYSSLPAALPFAHLKDRPGLTSPFSSVRAKGVQQQLPPVSSERQDDATISSPLSTIPLYKADASNPYSIKVPLPSGLTATSPAKVGRKKVSRYSATEEQIASTSNNTGSVKGLPSIRLNSSDQIYTVSPSRIPRLSSNIMSPSNRLSRPKYPSTVSAGSTRDSSYSSFSELTTNDNRYSGIATIASTVSIQRAAAQTRPIANVQPASPRPANIEKSIGVTTRSRRSRETSARSYSRASVSISNLKEEKIVEPANRIPHATTSRTTSPGNMTEIARQPLSLNMTRPGKQEEQLSDEYALLSASTSTAHRHLSPATPVFGLEELADDSHSGSNSMDLDPYSDTWGQNSTVAAETASSEPSTDTSISLRRQRNGSFTSATSSLANRSILSSLTTAREVGMVKSASSSRSTSIIKGKEYMLEQLLASLALIDSRPYQSLHSIEEVESYKKELIRVEKRMVDVQHKLKVEMRVRDAADKLRKTGLRRQQHGSLASAPRSSNSGSEMSEKEHMRTASIASAAHQIDLMQAEAGVTMATKRTDAICKDLIDAKEEAMVLQRKLLEHQTRTLALRVSTLEEEQAEQLKVIEEEEKSKVGANLAIEEVDKLRDKLSRLEKTLEHEKRDREEEVGRWKKKYEGESLQWEKRQDEDEQKFKLAKEESKRQTELAIKQIQAENTDVLSKEAGKRTELEQRLAEQIELVSQLKERQNQSEQLELEVTAERNIMMARQQLFVAFEKRLNRAETRLREQDDRCAQMLGKVDGREEMDNMLERIKAGYGAVKKEKTAGQDIDGLIDSITTHIGDLEDELHRAGKGQESPTSHRALEMQLEDVENELRIWKAEAENAKKSLAIVQRQSTSSVRSRSIVNHSATTEAEARLALLERKNVALEAELVEVRLKSGICDHSSSPQAKVAGIEASANESRDRELLHNAIHALLYTLPALDPMCMDLGKLQMDLCEASHHSATTTATDDTEEDCHEVMDRSRALVTVSTRLVDRALASESKQEAFEGELIIMERQCEDLRSALEDLRRGNASHKARELTLQTTVNELRKSLTAKNVMEMNLVQLDKMTPSFPSNESLGKSFQNHSSSSSSGGVVNYAKSAASRRGKGIPKPLPVSRSNSNLSFTSSPRLNASSIAQSASMPRNLKVGMRLSSSPSEASNIHIPPPRSMTLGMGIEQLRLRVRQLETDLIQAKSKSSTNSIAPPTHAIELQQELVRELDEHRRELDYVKGVESKQRIELLDELTTLTSEVSEARAQLRVEQRKKGKNQAE